MPRDLPALADGFEVAVRRAEEYVVRLEQANASLGSMPNAPQIGVSALELSYELAYLRIFLAWEEFLSECFLRLLCGYQARGIGQEPLRPGVHYLPTIAQADAAVLGGQRYKLWHSPQQVATRAQGYFQNGNFERVVSSAAPMIEECAVVRHRIAHAQDHARREFDLTTMALAGKRYPASRAGRFLRDWDASPLQRRRWLVVLSSRLCGLARQLCP